MQTSRQIFLFCAQKIFFFFFFNLHFSRSQLVSTLLKKVSGVDQLFAVLSLISYAIALGLFLVTIGEIVYQLATLFIPYWISRAIGQSFHFPAYFHDVYGEDADQLSLEHYGYLLSAVGTCVCVGRFVLVPNFSLGRFASIEKGTD